MNQTDYTFPTISLWPNFNFSAESTLFFRTPESLTEIGFLIWALADGNRRVRVGTDARESGFVLNGLRYIYWPVDIRPHLSRWLFLCFLTVGFVSDMEGYNYAEYDPSLTQIFFDDEAYEASLPSSAPKGTDFAVTDNGLPIGVAVAIALAIIVLIAAAGAATWFIMRRRSEKTNHARMREKLDKANSQTRESSVRTETRDSKESIEGRPSVEEPAGDKPARGPGWAKGTTKTARMTNTADV